MNESHKKFLFFLLRFFAAYVFMSIAVFFSCLWIAERLIPAIEKVILMYGSAHEITNLKLLISDENIRFVFTFTLNNFSNTTLQHSAEFADGISANALFVPHIIFYSFILSWGGMTWKQRLVVIALSIPVMTAFLVTDAAMSISSVNEQAISASELQVYLNNHTFRCKLIGFITHFFNTGGRQFMGILMILITIIFVKINNFIPKNKNMKHIISRNDSCICGSGKKYKNCCG